MSDTYLVLNHTFSAIRVFDYTLTPTRFTLKVHCHIPQESDSAYTPEEKASISYQVIKLWMNNMLDEVTMLSPTSSLGNMMYDMVESKIMTTPGDPDDNVLARILHSKISKIAKDNMIIDKLILSSSDTEDTERHWRGTDYHLPGIDYMDSDTVHKFPWWERSSIDISDIISDELTDEELNELLGTDTVLRDYENALYADMFESKNESSEAEIIEGVWKK